MPIATAARRAGRTLLRGVLPWLAAAAWLGGASASAATPAAARAAPSGVAVVAQADATARADAAAVAAPAAAASAPPPSTPGGALSAQGADTCLGCHDDEGAAYSAKALFKGRHAARGDRHGPFGAGGLQCEACHGPGANHSAKGSRKKSTINSQKPDSFMPAAQRDAACLSCHRGGSHAAWPDGVHARSGVACADCHRVHAPGGDAVLAPATQTPVCASCHAAQRNEFLRASAHPLRHGSMRCTDCHAPHGSAAAASLKRSTANETCTACHAAQRGPRLWPHAPVTEDCGSCHVPHGSVRPALLAQNPPLLCQQCHAAAGHPAVARSPAALPGAAGQAGGAAYLVAGSCLNCHVQVHGSNHPAGAKLLR